MYMCVYLKMEFMALRHSYIMASEMYMGCVFLMFVSLIA